MIISEKTYRDKMGAVGTCTSINKNGNGDLGEGETPSDHILATHNIHELIELHNALSKLLLKAGKADDHGISSARSYGMPYLVEQTCLKFGIAVNNAGLFFGLIAALIDDEISANCDWKSLLKRQYFASGQDLNVEILREFIDNLDLSEFESAITPKEAANADASSDEIHFKLNAWCQQGDLTLAPLFLEQGFKQLIDLAQQIRWYIQSEVQMNWHTINSEMRELNVIEIEDGALKLKNTTRPTTKQLMILYRLGFDAPDSIIDHEELEPVAMEEPGLDFDVVMELLEL